MIRKAPNHPRNSGFTLIELVLTLAIAGIVLGVISTVYFGSLRLRNRTTEMFDQALPVQNALNTIRKDLGGVMLPGGALSGELQSLSTSGSSATTLFTGLKVSPEFYTNTGMVDDLTPFADVQKVSYYLATPTNFNTGQDLMRVTSRNLLTTSIDEPTTQLLMENVSQVLFEYYDGLGWVSQWDSTVSSNLPTAIKMQIVMSGENEVWNRQAPIELVVPIMTEMLTNVVEETEEDAI